MSKKKQIPVYAFPVSIGQEVSFVCEFEIDGETISKSMVAVETSTNSALESAMDWGYSVADKGYHKVFQVNPDKSSRKEMVQVGDSFSGRVFVRNLMKFEKVKSLDNLIKQQHKVSW